MSDDPKRGVVDRNCRVHGVENLFIAGGSVFPTVGISNPTLTIVALAIRLADFLRDRMEGRAAVS
jgi:choline dehydrogenase-like flavoprotein